MTVADLVAGPTALCADPSLRRLVDAAMNNPTSKAGQALATVLCPRCELRDTCLSTAVEGIEHGIWGGLTSGQRSYRHDTGAVSRLRNVAGVDHGIKTGVGRRGER